MNDIAPLRKHRAPIPFAALGLIFSFGLFAWYYLNLRYGFYDDVFIYLHTARNGADYATWQYFPLADRPALLASSPLKLVLLTAAAKTAGFLGYGERTLGNAKLSLVLYAPLGWAMWYPFWRYRKTRFLWLGTTYFVYSLGLDAVVDFEAGLLFTWVATLTALIVESRQPVGALAWVVPLGLFIRPDLAVLVVAVTTVVYKGSLLRQLFVASLTRGALILVCWVTLSFMMRVWPLPVTYWVKAAVPLAFEKQYMIEVLFERIGLQTASRILPSPAFATLLGVLILSGFGIATVRNGRTRLAALVALVVGGLLFSQMPANYWWYYQNLVMILLGVTVGILASSRWLGMLPDAQARWAAAFTVAVSATILAGRGFTDGPTNWRMDAPSFAQGYVYLASKAVGDGTYALPDIGAVFIKSPEIGMISFFSGPAAYIWDAAGLAQPLDADSMLRSPLRYLYPGSLREPAWQEASRLAARSGQPLRVLEVWAMPHRNFDDARRVCRYVIEEGRICANDYSQPVQQ